jgi:nucleotidyltransferase substrate binding protein (TIGR01987 family)
MLERPDIRWKQRFANFSKAFEKLNAIVVEAEVRPLSEIEIEGLIQRFEYTYELAWKTLQDLLRERGYTELAGPGPVLEQALQDGLIADTVTWRKLKKARELTSHTYDEATAASVYKDVRTLFFPALAQLKEHLSRINA